MRRAIRLPIIAACVLTLTTAVFATTYHTIKVDGVLSDFAADERFADDSWTDSIYNVNNELHGVRASWDATTLYLGFDYRAWNTGLIFLLDTGKSGGVSDLCGPTYSKAFQANVQGPAWDMMVGVWIYGDKFTAPVVSVHRLANNKSSDVTLFPGVSIAQKEKVNTTSTSPRWEGEVELGLSWALIYQLPAGKVPSGAKIRLVGVLRGDKNNAGLGDTTPNPSAPNSTGKLTKTACGSGSGLGNKMDRFHEFTVDCDKDGVPDRNRKPNVVACPTVVKKDGGVPKPDQKVVKPDQKVVKPDQKVAKPDQKVTKPDQKVAQPDQKTTPKDQKVTQKDTGGSANKDKGNLPDDLGWADMPLSDGTGKADAGIGNENTGCACTVNNGNQSVFPAMLLALTLLGLAIVRRRR